MKLSYPALLGATLFGFAYAARAQELPTTVRVVVINPAVGPVIDAREKSTFGLFPYYSATDFEQARFTRALAPDSAVVLYVQMRDGRTVSRPFSEADFRANSQAISDRLNVLYNNRNGGGSRRPASATMGVAAGPPETVGASYAVDLTMGSSLIGQLTAADAEALEFDTRDLGHVRILRRNVRHLLPLTAGQTRRGWDPVGNGHRLFFAPTARNLRAGEFDLRTTYVRSDVFLIGADVGITNGVSLGLLGMLPIGPYNTGFVALTPKFSAPVSETFHLGAGGLLTRLQGTTVGLAYGMGTYGTADHNLTVGLGYASVAGRFNSTPLVVVGGTTRLAKRISLMNETYISSGSVLGLFGLRVASQQVSGRLGVAYGSYFTISPAFAEIAFRFGRGK